MTHPSVFAPHGSVIGAPVEVGETLQVDSGLYPDETVTLQDVRPILDPSSAEAHYSLQVCDRGESGGIGAIRGDLPSLCARLEPVAGFVFDAAPAGLQGIVSITPVEPGRIVIRGFRVEYRQGIRFGREHAGMTVEVRAE